MTLIFSILCISLCNTLISVCEYIHSYLWAGERAEAYGGRVGHGDTWRAQRGRRDDGVRRAAQPIEWRAQGAYGGWVGPPGVDGGADDGGVVMVMGVVVVRVRGAHHDAKGL